MKKKYKIFCQSMEKRLTERNVSVVMCNTFVNNNLLFVYLTLYVFI